MRKSMKDKVVPAPKTIRRSISIVFEVDERSPKPAVDALMEMFAKSLFSEMQERLAKAQDIRPVGYYWGDIQKGG